MNTTVGTISLEFFDDDAPKTVANFRKLAADGFHDGIIREVRGFAGRAAARRSGSRSRS
jgi:peptidyl-prolyl cis-trans isomerase B (cyclophilin B)